jgi:hypothetical protein
MGPTPYCVFIYYVFILLCSIYFGNYKASTAVIAQIKIHIPVFLLSMTPFPKAPVYATDPLLLLLLLLLLLGPSLLLLLVLAQLLLTLLPKLTPALGSES